VTSVLDIVPGLGALPSEVMSAGLGVGCVALLATLIIRLVGRVLTYLERVGENKLIKQLISETGLLGTGASDLVRAIRSSAPLADKNETPKDATRATSEIERQIGGVARSLESTDRDSRG
jgi:hypothetical protein